MKNSLLEQKRAAHFIKNRNEISITIYPDIFLKKIYRKRVNFIISFLDLILIYSHISTSHGSFHDASRGFERPLRVKSRY